MKRILFLTNYASPYRVRFFDELAKTAQVTVLYSDRRGQLSHRNDQWFEEGKGGFRTVQLDGAIGRGRKPMCLGVVKWLKRDYDAIIVAGYSSPTVILAMLWMRLNRIPFYMEIDGGMIREDGKAKYLFKRFLVKLADRYLSSGSYPTQYLIHYGAKPERIAEYPFTSLAENEILSEAPAMEEKKQIRERLGICEEKVILSVGQFIHRKGFDVLLESARELPDNVGIYIVGGEATEEYLALRESLGLTNVHFWGFRPREALAEIYRCADLFVLPTREDIWGLVINEAMAYGLPVVTTDKCVAGLELVENGVNGALVPSDDPEALRESICRILAGDIRAMGQASLNKIRGYTLEKMAQAHMALLEGTEK